MNLAKLVEETVEGCWIGQRAKSLHTADDIGSFYSPPTATSHSSLRRGSNSVMPLVETVIDIGLREKVSHHLLSRSNFGLTSSIADDMSNVLTGLASTLRKRRNPAGPDVSMVTQARVSRSKANGVPFTAAGI